MSDLTPVRDEDSFDIAKVHDWLNSYIDETSLPELFQFRSGASNLTYLLKYPDRELVLRRPPVGTKAVSAHDMKREFLIQSRLKPVYDLVPHVIALCEDHSILGSDFYVMDRIEGEIFRRDVPETLSREDISIMATSLVSGLAQLHSVDASVLDELNKGSGYVTRQVEGWSKRYRSALTDDVPDGEDVMNWLLLLGGLHRSNRCLFGHHRCGRVDAYSVLDEGQESVCFIISQVGHRIFVFRGFKILRQ